MCDTPDNFASLDKYIDDYALAGAAEWLFHTV